MPSRRDEDQVLRGTACRAFSRGQCQHLSCPFSHTILDISRLTRLFRDSQPGPDYSRLRLKLTLNVKATATFTGPASQRDVWWTLSLPGGRSLRDVHSTNAIEAFKKLEDQVYGTCLVVTRHSSDTICRKYLQNRCFEGSECRNRHDLFDTKCVEVFAEKLLQLSRRTHDSSICLEYRSDDPRYSGQWEVAFTIRQGSDVDDHAVVDADLGSAMNTATAIVERRLSNTDTRPTTEHRVAPTRSGDESPPSYAVATSTLLPSYYSAVDRPSTLTNTGPFAPSASRCTHHSARGEPFARPAAFPASHEAQTRLFLTSSYQHMPPPPPNDSSYNAPASERRPLLSPARPDMHTTYNAINHPASVRLPARRSSSRSSYARSWGQSTEDEGMPLVLQFLGLVMLAAIAWVFIVVITLPCTEASC